MYRNLVITTLVFSLLVIFIYQPDANAKKIKQVHKIETPRSGNTTNDLLTKKPKRIYTSDGLRCNDDTTLTYASPAANLTESNKINSLTNSISFSGYDKPAPSSKESFHITNSSATTINKVGIRITYLDLKDRMLHSRDVEVDCYVPSGESRLAAIPSWDIQHTFFYYLGPEPKKVATPYKVIIKLLWVEI
ncbi:MAG: hypothetical protein K2J63_12800 [Muribaculaceae bacterium]|nr:hypothetical protein [Muribaculaceae bacterium]